MSFCRNLTDLSTKSECVAALKLQLTTESTDTSVEFECGSFVLKFDYPRWTPASIQFWSELSLVFWFSFPPFFVRFFPSTTWTIWGCAPFWMRIAMTKLFSLQKSCSASQMALLRDQLRFCVINCTTLFSARVVYKSNPSVSNTDRPVPKSFPPRHDSSSNLPSLCVWQDLLQSPVDVYLTGPCHTCACVFWSVAAQQRCYQARSDAQQLKEEANMFQVCWLTHYCRLRPSIVYVECAYTHLKVQKNPQA